MDIQSAVDLVQSVLYLETRMGYRVDLKEAWETIVKTLEQHLGIQLADL